MLRVEGISKTFFAGTVNEKLALKNVSLEMQTGDFITVIGGNGAGKSTLMNSIAGVFTVKVWGCAGVFARMNLLNLKRNWLNWISAWKTA